MKSYGSFAEIYDELMDDFDYERWAEYYISLISRDGKLPKKVCECACGTGSLTIPIAASGISLIGADLSEDMLRVAADKARKAGQQIRFICQDMRELTLPSRVDAVLCTCDGLNYLTEPDGAARFFHAANAALKPGGRLAFDISSAYKLEKVLGSAFYGEERDDVAYLWSNSWDAAARTVTMDLTFFQREADGRYRRFSEQHIQRAYTREELTKLLTEAGFEDIRVYADMTYEEPTDETLRLHFIANKRSRP